MLKVKSYIIGFLLFLFSGATFGEPYPKHFYNGLKNSFDDPAILAWAGGIYLLHYFDKPVKENLTGKLMPSSVSKIADYYGRGINFGISTGYVLLDGTFNDVNGKDIRKNLQYNTETYFYNALLTFGLKEFTRRQRPNSSNHQSFPSGHTSSSFVVAATMQQLYGKKVGITFYTIAAITGLQRIHAQRHWLTDVLSGALLGTLIGNGFGELLKDDRAENPPLVSVTFMF